MTVLTATDESLGLENSFPLFSLLCDRLRQYDEEVKPEMLSLKLGVLGIGTTNNVATVRTTGGVQLSLAGALRHHHTRLTVAASLLCEFRFPQTHPSLLP